MSSSLYILSTIFCIVVVLSSSLKEFRAAAIVILFAEILSLSLNNTVMGLYSLGSVAGGFFLTILSFLVTFIMLTLYRIEKQIMVLKLATCCAVFTCVHMLYIMTYIEPIRAASWYYAPLFDKTYWYYGELQIVLTLYMISLFWKSGIRGLYVGFDKARSYLNNVHSVRGGINTNTGVNSSLLVGSDKSNKKGVQQ